MYLSNMSSSQKKKKSEASKEREKWDPYLRFKKKKSYQ